MKFEKESVIAARKVFEFAQKNEISIKLIVKGEEYVTSKKINAVENRSTTSTSQIWVYFVGGTSVNLELDEVQSVRFNPYFENGESVALKDFDAKFEKQQLEFPNHPLSIFFEKEDQNTIVFSVHYQKDLK